MVEVSKLRKVRTHLSQLLPLLVAVGAIVYFGRAYLPLASAYLAAHRQARELMRSSTAPGSDPEAAVVAFVNKFRAETGIAIDPRDVKLKAGGGQIRQLQLELRLPISFPLLNAGRTVHFAVATSPDVEQE